MAIAGIYQMDDDGVINPDTINLVPGTVIPKAPNSKDYNLFDKLVFKLYQFYFE